MRISSAQLHQTSLQNIQTNQRAVFDRSLEASTGVKIQRASDDPVAAGRIRRMDSELDQLDTYEKNLSSGTMRLELQEARLDEAYNTLLQVQEMVLMASDSSYGAGELTGVGNELSALVDNLVSALNAQDNEGNYLFSGSQIDTPAVDKVNGLWTLMGDDQASQVRASSSLEVQTGVTAFDALSDLTAINELAALAENLKNGDDSQTQAQSLVESMAELVDGTTSAITRVGTLVNNINTLSDNIADQVLATEDFRGMLRDADSAEAIMEMQQAQTALEASIHVYRQVSRLNLFSAR